MTMFLLSSSHTSIDCARERSRWAPRSRGGREFWEGSSAAERFLARGRRCRGGRAGVLLPALPILVPTLSAIASLAYRLGGSS